MKNVTIKQLILGIIAVSAIALAVNPDPCGGVPEHEAGVCQLYFPLVNFVCYLTFVWWLVAKYALPALRDRKVQFEVTYNKAVGQLRDADHELHEAQLSLKHFETEKAEIVDRLKKEGAQTAEAIVRQAQASAEGIERDARRQIEKAQSSAAEEVRHAVVGKAVGRARKALTDKLSTEDDRRLRQEVIDSLFRGA